MKVERGINGEEIEESLGELFFRCLRKHGKKPIQLIADTSETDTCNELLTRSIRTAIKLRQENIKPNDVIGICTSNHKNSCVPLIAAQFLGAINTNFEFNMSPEIIKYFLKLTETKIIFVDSESATVIEKCIESANINCKIVVFNGHGKHREFSEYLQPSIEEDNFVPYKVKNVMDTAMVLFSSGTTGYPKAICLTHHGLKGQVVYDRLFNQSCIEPGLQPVYLIYSRLYWVTCVGSLIKSILYGSAKVICSSFNSVHAWDIIKKYKVTTMFLVPHLAAEFAERRPGTVNTESLSVFYIGGAKVPEKLMVQLNQVLPNTKIAQINGQTETSGNITTFSPSDAKEMKLQKKYPTSCGIPLDYIEWKIVDTNTGERLGVNQKGELRLKMEYFMNGYYKSDASNEFDSEGFLKTGDVLYCNEEGCLFLVDRIKEMFKYRGMQIVPSVLEDVLLRHPAVKEAIVTGIPHDIDEHHPIGIVTIKEGQSTTPEEIESFFAGRVFETQKLRAGVMIVDELPRTATGKINRSVIRSKLLKGW